MLHRLKSLLLYTKTPTAALIETVGQADGAKPLLYLSLCRARLLPESDFNAVWQGAVRDAAARMHLTAADRKVLSEVGGILGASDAQTQAEQLELSIQFLQENLDSAESDCRQKGKLYRSLGLCAGIGLAIILL